VRVEYHPTEKGTALLPVLDAVARWAEVWIEPETVPVADERFAKELAQ